MKSPLVGTRPSMRSEVFGPLVLLSIALPTLVMFLVVWQNSVMLPYLDDWQFVVDLGRLRDGDFGIFEYLWRQHNEHRPIMWKVVSLLSVTVSPFYYYKIATYVSFLITLAALALTILTIRALDVQSRVLGLAFACLIFSPVFNETWIWVAAAVQFKFLLFSLALLGWALTRWPGRWRGTIFAAMACFVGTASAGSGLALWVCALLVLFAYQKSGVGERIWGQLLFLSICAMLVYWAYFSTYHVPVNPERTDPLVFMATQPVYFAQVVMALLGKPLVPVFGTLKAAIAGLVGFFLLLASAIWLWFRNRERLLKSLPLFVLAAFAVLNALVVVWFRSHLELEELSFSGRYFISSIFFWIAIFTLLAILIEENATKLGAYLPATEWIFWCSLVLVCGTAYLFAMRQQTGFMKDMKIRDVNLHAGIIEYESLPDSEIPEFDWWISKYFLRELERQRLSVFAAPRAPTHQEGISGDMKLKRGILRNETNGETLGESEQSSPSPRQQAIDDPIQENDREKSD